MQTFHCETHSALHQAEMPLTEALHRHISGEPAVEDSDRALFYRRHLQRQEVVRGRIPFEDSWFQCRACFRGLPIVEQTFNYHQGGEAKLVTVRMHAVRGNVVVQCTSTQKGPQHGLVDSTQEGR